ncbi:type II toxin-antitoxin system mRNA interferase toxin, RelE/StbE family [Merismopedia glauca CCAP 1448/3]|uniref:Type II toxin-antitoxin system mRNA interferase toxin, RelE/StbE family n=2 Tax=Merismopedia TaxID=53402 RepID=A0A2T1BYD2_9CYAN|nr:type II toxin-antitoxin system mRNA interferase toxin, RelE/StbE family [Merismopedia glauca]PSB00954.1 type II toxin-antitoxin system mRNA interferase toxin, RelE/StbE family [Merismopedia glauca CCAP 1448/3]
MAQEAPDLVERFQQRVDLFVQEPFHPSLRTHALSGHLEGCWSLSITYEYRLIFKFISEERVLLIDLGSHDEVY